MVIEPKSKHLSKMSHQDLLLAEDLVYKPSGLILQNLKIEDESVDYGASEFTIKNRSVKFRVGKITPTKIGQFVTFWKRIGGKGPILPYEFTDSFDFLVVSVRAENHFGQFVFQKLYCAKKELYLAMEMKVRELCAFILLGIKLIILKLRKRKFGNYNILSNYLRILLISHA